jgi:O-antigen ligase
MRKLSAAAVAMILAIALYFTLFWGFEALRMLTSPTYGLDNVWRSQFVFEIGRLFSLSPVGLIKLAAFFATLKLAVAAICAVHIADRFRALAGGKAQAEVLESGLMLVVAISIASAGPAIWQHNADLVREQVIQLLLAAIAAALCILERSYERTDEQTSPPAARVSAAAPAARWYSPLRR